MFCDLAIKIYLILSLCNAKHYLAKLNFRVKIYLQFRSTLLNSKYENHDRSDHVALFGDKDIISCHLDEEWNCARGYS